MMVKKKQCCIKDMAFRKDLDALYMGIAERTSLMSNARRSKVGAILEKDDNIISYGWNGTPAGDDNNCEIELDDGSLRTKPEVLHAESNALSKLTKKGGIGSDGSTLYVTLSPCFECSKLIKQAGIRRVVYRDAYRDLSGIDFLKTRGVTVEKFSSAE